MLLIIDPCLWLENGKGKKSSKMKNMEKSKLQYLEEFNITCTESSNSPLLSICHWNIKQQWIWKGTKNLVNSTQNWK